METLSNSVGIWAFGPSITRFVPPGYHVGLALGLRWPQPTTFEFQNLVRFHDLARAKGMKMLLRLVNTHKEDLPATNSTAWLGAIEQAGRVRR